MELSDWRTIGGVGIWPMGVKGAHKWGEGTDENVLLWERPCLFGTRIKNDKIGEGRPIEGDNALGHYVEDPFWRGDIIGGTHWQRNTRDIGAWRWSWPVVIGEFIPSPAHMTTFSPLTGGGFDINRPNLPTGGGTTGQKHDHHLQPIKRINPYSGEYEADDRFTSITAKMPKDDDAQDIWPWFPKGWIGIMEGADWEDDQQELFHSTDPRIVVAQKGNPWEMGSWMCDLKDEGIDKYCHASVQSMFWVIQRPKCDDVQFGTAADSFGVPNTIAWNIGGSGQGDHRGGLMIDKDSEADVGTPTGGGGGAPVETGSKTNLNPNSSFSFTKYSGKASGGGTGGPLGFISQRQAGPIEIPCTKFGPSSHHMGKDRHGNDIYSAHLSMNSYFTFPDGKLDGPLKHDGKFIPPDEAPELTFVWFGYDAGMPHDFIGGPRKGKHRWWCNTNKYSPPCSPWGNPTVGSAPGYGRTTEGGPGAAFMDAPLMVQGSPLGALSNTYMAEWTYSLLGGDSPFAFNGMSIPQYGQAGEDPWWETWWKSYQDTLMDVGEKVEEWRDKLPGAKTLADAVERFWKKVAKTAAKEAKKTGTKVNVLIEETLPLEDGKKKFGNFPTAGEIWEGMKDVISGQEPLLPGKKKHPLTWSIFDLYEKLWKQAKELAQKFDQDPPPQQPPPNLPSEDKGHGFEGDGPLDPNAFQKRVKVPKDTEKKTPQNPPPKKKNPGGGGGGGGGQCGGSNQYAQKVGPYSMSEQRGFLTYQFSSMEEGGLAYIWRPQKFQSREIDWKKWTKPNRSYRGYTADSFSPITCRFEAYGAQGARNDASDDPLDKATPWVYTHKPQTYRYMSGTANGGVVMTSPEVDLADWSTGLAPITEVAQSTTHFVAGRGTRFGAGMPDLFLGGMEEGYSWYEDGSGGLTFSSNVESTPTERVKFSVNGCVGVGGDSYGGSLGSVVFIANATRAPVSNPTSGGILYVTGGALTYRGSSGTVTTLAPA